MLGLADNPPTVLPWPARSTTLDIVTTLVWFREDLRLLDHAALSAAVADSDGTVCLFILDEESDGVRSLGGASKWWLHHSLRSLSDSLARLGVPLILRRGRAETVLPEIVTGNAITRVLWNRRYGGAERRIDTALKEQLRAGEVEAHSFPGNLLHEPWTVTTKEGKPYRVYTPFWRSCVALPPPPAPIDQPLLLTAASQQPSSDLLDDWKLLPTNPDWAKGLAAKWQPGERSALHGLDEFLAERAAGYTKGRDFPATESTSELSPHLRWGEISPRTIWHRALASGADVGTFLSELGWREFAWHTLYNYPSLATENLNSRYNDFPWAQTDELASWQQGQTGFPLVDAGMRELWHTGTMHNRVRMVVASFLTKNLLIDWRLGEQWFWDTLVDADEASNPFNWQWVAGSGLDAAPYFRIFNPTTQHKRFDPDSEYVDRWAPDSLLITPLVDLKESRIRALSAYDRMQATHSH